MVHRARVGRLAVGDREHLPPGAGQRAAEWMPGWRAALIASPGRMVTPSPAATSACAATWSSVVKAIFGLNPACWQSQIRWPRQCSQPAIQGLCAWAARSGGPASPAASWPPPGWPTPGSAAPDWPAAGWAAPGWAAPGWAAPGWAARAGRQPAGRAARCRGLVTRWTCSSRISRVRAPVRGGGRADRGPVLQVPGDQRDVHLPGPEHAHRLRRLGLGQQQVDPGVPGRQPGQRGGNDGRQRGGESGQPDAFLPLLDVGGQFPLGGVQPAEDLLRPARRAGGRRRSAGCPAPTAGSAGRRSRPPAAPGGGSPTAGRS